MDTASASAPAAAFDWDRLAACHRQGRPVCLPVTPLWPVASAHRLAIAIARPSRAGIRFFAVPAVRFFAGNAEIRAPGARLPDERDDSPQAYLRRLRHDCPDVPAWLEIESPLVADAAAWGHVRDFLWGWCERLGCPTRPVTAYLLLGRYRRDVATHGVATLIVPLLGRVMVRPAAGGDAQLAGPGQVLYRPPGEGMEAADAAGCVALRLEIPVQRTASARELVELFASLVQPEVHPEGGVPALPSVPAVAADGAVALPDALARGVEALGGFVAGPTAELAHRVQWLARASACALEPAPGCAKAPVLSPADSIRAVPGARILETAAGEGTWLWAVNGHTLAVDATPASGALRGALARGGASTVAALCGSDPALRAALAQLCAARGVVREAADVAGGH
ncbi:hypothetical protein [Luteimonas sp. FCS-9]|uniref:hypothetical protein n=1 Tax=Luteimonas sp. FCS-9 TaxID=1547516 RepID=UPI000B17527F|nr:hypothetical protein [Luteimonas sp. FCS-9]